MKTMKIKMKNTKKIENQRFTYLTMVKAEIFWVKEKNKVY